MANYNVTITDEGAALLSSVIAAQGTLTVTEARLSDTNYVGQESTLTIGTFGGVFLTGTASASAPIFDPTTIKISANFNGSTLAEPHEIYSLGIIATDGNTTALLAVCTTSNPDTIEPAVGTAHPSTYAFNINLSVSSTSDITVVGTTAAVLYDTDTVDNLNSTDTKAPLSANMGHTLGEEVNAMVNVYSAKNLLKNDATSTTLNTVAITVNDDKSVTLSGTASADSYLLLSQFTLDAGTYKLTGTPSGVSDEYLFAENLTNPAYYHDFGSGATFTLAVKSTIKAYIFTKASHAITSTYKPMICDARIVDPTYEPYAETNQQLTNNKANRADLATINATGSTNTTGATITAGTYFYLNGSLCIAIADIAVNATFTLNTNYVVTSIGGELRTKRAVRAREVTYAPGVVAYNGVEKCICTEFSDGSVLVNGLIEVTNTWEDTPNNGILFTLPNGVSFGNWGNSQRWFRFGELNGSGFVNGLCGVYGTDFRMWGQNVSDIKNKNFVVDISW